MIVSLTGCPCCGSGSGSSGSVEIGCCGRALAGTPPLHITFGGSVSPLGSATMTFTNTPGWQAGPISAPGCGASDFTYDVIVWCVSATGLWNLSVSGGGTGQELSFIVSGVKVTRCQPFLLSFTGTVVTESGICAGTGTATVTL